MPGDGVESIISSSDGFVTWHLHVRLDTVLEARELPTTLDASLADVDAECVDSIVSSSAGFVAWCLHVSNVLEAKGLPTGISSLVASMADVDADCFALCR